MNAAAPRPVVARPAPRHPSSPTYVVERFHRAFDDELRTLRGIVGHMRLPIAARDDVDGALAALAARLDAHDELQQAALFPPYARGAPCTPAAYAAWANDALAVDVACADVRAAVAGAPLGVPLSARVARLLDDVADHARLETEMLAAWAGLAVEAKRA